MVVNLISMANKITKMGRLAKQQGYNGYQNQQNQSTKEIMDTKVIIIKSQDILNLINMEINPNFQG